MERETSLNRENQAASHSLSDVRSQAMQVREAAKVLARADRKAKDEALRCVIEALNKSEGEILAANQLDVDKARSKGMRESLVDRLALTPARMDGMKQALEEVIRQDDPVGRMLDGWVNDDGLSIRKVSVPLGVIAIIYESRPNVTVEAFSLALKSGNGILLRGSSSAVHSNQALVAAIQKGLSQSSIPPEVVGYVDDLTHEKVQEMITMRGIIDLVIPRGGAGLIRSVVDHATVPVIETGTGNNTIFVDDSADQTRALDIIENAKVQRPGTCNAIENVFVHRAIAKEFLPKLAERLGGTVEIRGYETSPYISPATFQPATEEDLATEFLDLVMAVRVVDSVEEAISFISRFGTGHSEAILTQSVDHANLFLQQVDAAAVYVNASTRFTDGGMFGFGGEMGISTQKMHARGPMGLAALTTYKYQIIGLGQIRG